VQPDLTDEIAALIAARGSVSLERFMGLANAHYYATRDPLGAGGDFITSPEISQMFGEVIGLCLADLWQRADAPPCAYVELGPGRGTLAADALRAMKVAKLSPAVHFVETSPLLRDCQRERVPKAKWHDSIATLPKDRPLLIVANEFFDALPIRQYIRTIQGWRERVVKNGVEGFELVPGDDPADRAIPSHLRHADPGSVVEQRPAANEIMTELCERLARQGGVLIAIDYGHSGRAAGDTLQAIHAHAYADPLARPGRSDLTAHVDFGALIAAAEEEDVEVYGPVDQGQWLLALGLSDRAAKLARTAPERADEVTAAYRRLTHPEEMGELFKVLGVGAAGWPSPAGFG